MMTKRRIKGWMCKPFSKLTDKELRKALKLIIEDNVNLDHKILKLYEQIFELNKQTGRLLELYMEIKDFVTGTVGEGEPDDYVV